MKDVSNSFGVERDGILRLARSTDKSRAIWYHPDWRARQVQIYLNRSNESRSDGVSPMYIPHWEDDEIILNLFTYRRSSQCSTARWTDLMRMVFQCQEHNDRHGIASKIKAYAVAQKSDEEIGEMLGIDDEIVKYFLKMFYDIRPILHQEQRMASIVFPFNPQLNNGLSGSEKRESLWIAAAFSGGPELLDCFCMNQVKMAPEDIERALTTIVSMMTAKSLEYGMQVRSESVPRKAHFDQFLEMQEVVTKQMGVKATIDQINNEQKNNDEVGKWMSLIEAVGIRRAQGTVIDDTDAMVTNLSITELRTAEAGGSSPRKKKIKSLVTNPDNGMSIQSFNGEDS